MPSRGYIEAQNKLYEIYHSIGQLSPKKLARLEKEVKLLTKKNSWWLAYKAQPMLLEAISMAKALETKPKKGRVKKNVSSRSPIE